MIKKTIAVLSIVAASWVTWCLYRNYRSGSWSESCGFSWTNPNWRSCIARRVWQPALPAFNQGDVSQTSGSQQPDFIPLGAGSAWPYKSVWVDVDLLQEFGGFYLERRRDPLPTEYIKKPCELGAHMWMKEIQYACVEVQQRPNGLPDGAIVGPSMRKP